MESQTPSPVVLPVRDKHPQFGSRNWLAPNCTVVGDVTTGEDCSIWFGAIVRGDVCAIRLGTRVNIRDGPSSMERGRRRICHRDEASIGHKHVHGAPWKPGMGAAVMDRAVVGEGAVVAAGAVVLEGTQIGPGELWAGVPARKVKDVGPDLKAHLAATAVRYREYAGWFEQD